MATRDDVIPLETPYTDRNGTVHETLKRVSLLRGKTAFVCN